MNLLQRTINWLEAHRTVNVVLALAYFIFIFFMHDPVVNLSIWVMKNLSLPVYNQVVIVVAIVGLLLFTGSIFTQLKQRFDNRKLKHTYLFITLALIILHFKTMLEMNIEIIHIFEYPPLAFLLFPLTRRFGATVLFTIPFMLIDEWHQYVVLYPSYVDYFELNDVVMDMNGCGLTMIALMIFGVKGSNAVAPFWKRPEFITLCAVLIAVAIAVKTCLFTLYGSGQCANTIFAFNRIHEAQTFWRQYPGRDVIYHVMQPVEGIIAISTLALFYFGLDSLRNSNAN